ncbi:MAG: PIN domain-containing protein [Solirubrobacteraceae bacterium]
MLRALTPEVCATRLATPSRVRAIYPLLEIDGVTASCYARLADEQLRAGRKPRRRDTWIAATALRHAAAVITQDTDFTAFTSVTVAGPQRPQLSAPSEVILAANAHRDLERTVVDVQVLAHGPADASGGWTSAR